jgi:hypothetical protein
MAHARLGLPLLVTLAPGPTPGLAQETLEIAFFAPLTGFAAADGARHPAEIAVSWTSRSRAMPGPFSR